jgi:hypothetical protein
MALPNSMDNYQLEDDSNLSLTFCMSLELITLSFSIAKARIFTPSFYETIYPTISIKNLVKALPKIALGGSKDLFEALSSFLVHIFLKKITTQPFAR